MHERWEQWAAGSRQGWQRVTPVCSSENDAATHGSYADIYTSTLHQTSTMNQQLCIKQRVSSPDFCHYTAWLNTRVTPMDEYTDFAVRGFRHSAPAVWNSLPKTVLDSLSLTLFKSRLKSRLFHLAYNDRQWLTWPDLLRHRLWSYDLMAV